MKTIICDKCKDTTLAGQPLDYAKYKVEFGQENIFGDRGKIDLCEKCIKEFLNFIH